MLPARSSQGQALLDDFYLTSYLTWIFKIFLAHYPQIVLFVSIVFGTALPIEKKIKTLTLKHCHECQKLQKRHRKIANHFAFQIYKHVSAFRQVLQIFSQTPLVLLVGFPKSEFERLFITNFMYCQLYNIFNELFNFEILLLTSLSKPCMNTVLSIDSSINSSLNSVEKEQKIF